MYLSVLIVEDSQLFINSNKASIMALAKKYGVEVDIKVFSRVGESLKEYIRTNKIDIALLDVELDKSSGIAVGKYLKKYQSFVSLVFITFYKKYMEEAVLLDPIGFIEKPVEFSRLEKMFCKVIMEKRGKVALENDHVKIISFKRNRSVMEVRETEIIYMKIQNRKVLVVTKAGEFTINDSITKVGEKLNDFFVKVGRDAIVNRREIKRIENDCIIMSNDEQVFIPMHRRKEIVQKILG